MVVMYMYFPNTFNRHGSTGGAQGTQWTHAPTPTPTPPPPHSRKGKKSWPSLKANTKLSLKTNG